MASGDNSVRLRHNLLKLNPFARQRRQAPRCKLLPTRDVSKLAQVTAELCARDRQVSSRLAKAQKDFVLVSAKDEQQVQFASDSYCEFFGFRSDELVGKTSEDLFARPLTAFANTTRATIISTTISKKDGSSCVVELSITPLTDSHQQHAMYAVVVGQVFDCAFDDQADEILRFFQAAKNMNAAIVAAAPAAPASSGSTDDTTLIDSQSNKPTSDE